MKGKKDYQYSIIVPVYGSEPFLDRCIESLAGQQNAEIIFVDDGSKDQGGVMCDGYARQYENVRVFHKENGGLSSARNYGMREAQGKYILFVDPDDFVEPDMCCRISQILEQYGDVDVLVFDAWEEIGNDISRMYEQIHYAMKIESGKAYMLRCCQKNNLGVEVWRRMYRREFMEENYLNFKEGILHEDIEFTPRVLLAAESVLEIPDAFYHYIVRDNSMCTWKNRTNNIRDVFETLRIQSEIAKEQSSELKKWMLNHVLNTYLSTIYAERMYRKEYRAMVDKKFLLGKAATNYNRVRVALCCTSVWLYCVVNDFYKKVSK